MDFNIRESAKLKKPKVWYAMIEPLMYSLLSAECYMLIVFAGSG